MAPFESIQYSQIPPSQIAEWSDADLSGAIWTEAISIAGGCGYTVSSASALPLGFRAVLAEGSVRAHVEGDGLACAIWNDDGTEWFQLLVGCYQCMGLTTAIAQLQAIVSHVRQWQTSTGLTPRSLPYEQFRSSEIGIWLEARADELCIELECAFDDMMKFLRQHPEAFRQVASP